MQFFSGRYSKAIVSKIQLLFRVSLAILLALIINITGVILPSSNLTGNQIAEATTQSTLETGLSIFSKLEGLATAVSSFLPDITIFGNLINGNPALLNLNQNFQVTQNVQVNQKLQLFSNFVFDPNILSFSPSISLIGRVDFFFNIKEVNFIKIINNNGSSKLKSQALENYRLGIEESQKGNYESAIKHYTDALIKDGNFAEAYLSRGRAYSELGYLDRTMADYNKAMEVKAKFVEDADRYVDPLLGRGQLYIKQGDYQSALRDFTEAINRNPDYYEAYLSRAIVYTQTKEYQKALTDLNIATDLNLDYPAALFRRGSIKGELGDYQQAIADFSKTINSKANDAKTYYADAYYKRGLAYSKLGQKRNAIADFSQAIEENSNYRAAYYNRGVAHQAIGDRDAAIKDYSQSLLIYDLGVYPWVLTTGRSLAISPNGILAGGNENNTISILMAQF